MAGAQRRARVKGIARWAFRVAAALGVAACLVMIVRNVSTAARQSQGATEQRPTRADGSDGRLENVAERRGDRPQESAVAPLSLRATRIRAQTPREPAPDVRQTSNTPGELIGRFRRHLAERPKPEEAETFATWIAELGQILDDARVASQTCSGGPKLRALQIVHQCLAELGESEQEREAFSTYIRLCEQLYGKTKADQQIIAKAKSKLRKMDRLGGLEYFDQVLARSPEKTTELYVRYRVAGIYSELRKPKEACDILYKLMDDGKGTRCAVRACTLAEELLSNTGQYSEALALLDRLEDELAVNEDDKKYAQKKRGIVYYMAKNYPKAAAQFNAIVKAYPATDPVHQTARNFLNTLAATHLNESLP